MASPQSEAILLLLKKAQTECELFIILGDLFDLWLGDGEYFVQEYAPLIEEFKKLKKTCRLVYFEGNHDLHLQKFWGEKLGFEVLVKPTALDFHGLKIWAEHGDEINREDKDYLFLRWFLRTPLLEKLTYSLPSQISAFIGKKASAVSRQYTHRIENRSKEIFRKYAQDLALKNSFDLLLTGHTHIADHFEFESGGKSRRLINLGSWYDGAHYLEISPDRQIKTVNLN